MADSGARIISLDEHRERRRAAQAPPTVPGGHAVGLCDGNGRFVVTGGTVFVNAWPSSGWVVNTGESA